MTSTPISGDTRPTDELRLLVDGLKQVGFDLIDIAFLPHSHLRPGTVNSISVILNADRFIIYKCVSADAAANVASEIPHAFHAGIWEFRPTHFEYWS